MNEEFSQKEYKGIIYYNKVIKKSNVVDKIEQMNKKRENRRKKMEENKKNKAEKEFMNEAKGKMGDIDFENMIEQYRQKLPDALKHRIFETLKLVVCVRKRPIFNKELANEEIDCVSVSNPKIFVHDCKVRVDGITKYLDNHEFQFDNSFSQGETSKELYQHSIQPLLPMLLNKGVVTCFAYGQTGSGKTFTMKEVESYAISDIFQQSKKMYNKKTNEILCKFF